MDLTFREHGPGQTVDGLSETAVQTLKKIMTVSSAGPDRWSLTPGRKVGVIRIGDLTIRITPKVLTAHLLFLIDYAKKPVAWRESLAEVLETAELVATVADTYARVTERALLGGTLQCYRPVEGTLPVLKGRLRVATQLRMHHGAAFPLEVSYQEFGINTPENQVLKAATVRALQLPRLRPQTRGKLLRIAQRLTDVPAPDLAAAGRWRPTRLNVRYQSALGLAELILRGSSFDVPAGPVRAEGFMIDMYQVYEEFLCAALDQALSARIPGRLDHPDTSRHLDQGGALPMRPDFLWLTDGRPRLVVDAKYKADGKNKPEDIYQMLSYCSALGLPAGHLVYVGDADLDPIAYEVRASGIRIVRHTLNLSRPPTQLLAAIDDLATHIAAQSTAPTGQ